MRFVGFWKTFSLSWSRPLRRFMRLLLCVATLSTLALAGCTANDGHDDLTLGPGSFHMQLTGMPSGPVAPGQMFNVSVQAMAAHRGMHDHMSDHIGAHFWNQTHSDPTGALAQSTGCAHTGGSLPGEYRIQCTAPMQPGMYYLRAHARMADDGGMMHHWWGDEATFTVA
jgi:hypothetical protein